MLKRELVLICFILASVCADSKAVEINTTTLKPEPKSRFFGLENILGQIFHGPGYHNQQYPQPQYNDWQHIQTPDQAQSNLDQHLQAPLYPQGGFSQNNFGTGPSQNPSQFPNQQQMPLNQYPPLNTQGNFNGNNFGQNQIFNTGTLDDIPLQSGISIQGNWNPGNQFQNQGNQNQNGNQMLQNQNIQYPQVDDYNPAAILGKPVSMTTSVPDSIVFEDGCDTASQRQCVQDCQSSSEYRPVCGSNNVTYYNPGRFICARNCGVSARKIGKPAGIEFYDAMPLVIGTDPGQSKYLILKKKQKFNNCVA